MIEESEGKDDLSEIFGLVALMALAANYAGPAISLSFILSGFVCAFVGL